MEASQSVPELVAAARTNANVHEQIIAAEGQSSDELTAATTALELLAVDIFAVFEARMQHHFKRGPFARKLKALLSGAGQPDLAYRIYQYYLAINVLKHGAGASHRELLKSKTHLFVVRSGDESDGAGSLIDVTTPVFFGELTDAILESYRFLER